MKILKEETLTMDTLNDPAKLKEYRENLRKKAAGWILPEPTGILTEKKYSTGASDFIGDEIGHLMHDKGYDHERAVAAAINIAKDKGYKVPAKSTKEESALNEKWNKETKTPESKKGMWDGWTKEELRAEQSKLEKKTKRTPAESKRLEEVNFALRAKNDWGKAK